MDSSQSRTVIRALVMAAAVVAVACGSSGNSSNGGLGGGGGDSVAGTTAAGTTAAGTATVAENGGTTTATGGAGGASGSSATMGGGGAQMGGSAAGGTTAIGGASGSGGAAGAGGASGSNKVLIYGVTTGFRHGSIPAGCMALATAMQAVGLTSEQVGCTDTTNMPDPTKFTGAALAQYGAVILLANSGEPFGYPADDQIQNLVDYVRGGGGLIGIEDATHCYDGAFNGHPESVPYVTLVGGDFTGHPGGVAPATCTKVGADPSVAQFPATFAVTDEIYSFAKLNPANQVVLNCVSSSDKATVRPISWSREDGAGRYFYTALGHPDQSWTMPMDAAAPSSRLVEDHLIPALLWTMKRAAKP